MNEISNGGFVYSAALQIPVQSSPCEPSPCGPNSVCQDVNNSPRCSCLPEFIGSPPNCRPECTSNSECSNHLACIKSKCGDPCVGACGELALCRVTSHTPNCVCPTGYTGDPFVQCKIQQIDLPPETLSPCTPSPCGSNAICREKNNVGSCICSPGYFGNPYEGCRPECTVNTDCPSNRVCQQNKCQDPCPGTCGSNAQCQTVNHVPLCICIPGYTGNPFQRCFIQRKSIFNKK